MIQHYKPIDHIKVSTEMVEDIEKGIINYLKSNSYIHLSEKASQIKEFRLKYTKESYGTEIERVSVAISKFMAHQEALFNLMTKGKIMPVRISNAPSILYRYSFKIFYEEQRGSMTTSGDVEISIPIFIHETVALE